jgi:hypothetical protein
MKRKKERKKEGRKEGRKERKRKERSLKCFSAHLRVTQKGERGTLSSYQI